MARDLGLRDRLIAHGVTVVEVNGWKTRGSTSFSPDGSVNHHTACAPPRAGRPVPATPSLGTCINGRPDVPGPLCNVLLGRDRKAYLIAAGRANHAGKGGVRGLVGNSKVYGLEIEHAGTTAEGIDPGLVDTAARIHAAFAEGGDFDESKVVQHHEWTSRKIDFCKGRHSPDGFREQVGGHLRAPTPKVELWVPLIPFDTAATYMRDGKGLLVGDQDNEIGEVQVRLRQLGYWDHEIHRAYTPSCGVAMQRFKRDARGLAKTLGQTSPLDTGPTCGGIAIGALRMFTGG